MPAYADTLVCLSPEITSHLQSNLQRGIEVGEVNVSRVKDARLLRTLEEIYNSINV